MIFEKNAIFCLRPCGKIQAPPKICDETLNNDFYEKNYKNHCLKLHKTEIFLDIRSKSGPKNIKLIPGQTGFRMTDMWECNER